MASFTAGPISCSFRAVNEAIGMAQFLLLIFLYLLLRMRTDLPHSGTAGTVVPAHHFVDTSLVAASLKRGFKPLENHFQSQFRSHTSSSQHQDIGIIVPTAHFRGKKVVAE